jgi:2-keto-3-deoxy-L-rhamnonate aldolase RhmA
MKRNWVREKVLAGEPTVGSFVGLGSPTVVELLAHAGYDWLAIETEHSALDTAETQHMLMAVGNSESIPIVRVPSHDPIGIQRALDIGAMGVLVPMTRTAEQARAIVSATRYPPDGTRGFGPLRASKYTIDYPDYLDKANDNMLVALILETSEAIDNLEEIMSVPGVDAMYIGMYDLSLNLGLNPLDLPLPEIDGVIEKALATSRKTGVALGIGVRSPEDLDHRLNQGFRFIVYGTDYNLLLNAAKTSLQAFRDRT